MQSRYQYRPLQHPRSIRVLELLPARNPHNDLQCRVHHTSVDPTDAEHIKYQALSYVCGAKVGSRPIYCNGKTILITPNCQRALKRLRKDGQSRYLWVDAICIDQGLDEAAIDEKNGQLMLMGEIYANATRVLIWLGECPNISEAQLRRSARAARLDAWAAPFLRTNAGPGLDQDLLEQVHVAFSEMFDGSSTDEEEVRDRAFEQVLYFLESHPWFRRIWTFQEIAFAKKARILIGEATLPWETFEKVWLILGLHLQNHALRDDGNSQDWLRLGLARTKIRHRLQKNLPQHTFEQPTGNDYLILNQLYDHKSTDPKDMIFAIRPMLKRVGLELPKPDYGKSVEQIYMETVLKVIQYTNSLEIFIHSRPSNHSQFVLPSWVPDWSQSIGLKSDDADNAGNQQVHFLPSSNLDEGRPKLLAILREKPFATRHSKYQYPIHRIRGQLPLTGYPLGTIIHTRSFFHLEHRIVEKTVDDLYHAWLQEMNNITAQLDGMDDVVVSREEFYDWVRVQHLRDPRKSSKSTLLYGPKTFSGALTYRLNLGDQLGFNLSSGLVGTGENSIRIGDVVALVHGSDLPLILRPRGRHFRFVGCAYVWGAMQGALWPERDFSLGSVLSALSRPRMAWFSQIDNPDVRGFSAILLVLKTWFVESIKDSTLTPHIAKTMKLEEFVLV